jgi:hypothetical protein
VSSCRSSRQRSRRCTRSSRGPAPPLDPTSLNADPARLLESADGLARIAIYHGAILGLLALLMLVFAVWIKHGHTGPGGTLALSTATTSTVTAMVLVMLLPINNAISPRVVYRLAPPLCVGAPDERHDRT